MSPNVEGCEASFLYCFDNLTITAKKDVKIDEDIIDALVMRKVEINKVN
jgi:hypothetical protein